MAVQTLNLFVPAVLPASTASPIYSMPSTPATAVLVGAAVRFTNTDSVGHAITAYIVASGGSAGSTNCFMNAEPLAPNDHLDVPLPQMAAGFSFEAFADTASVITVTALSGVIVS